MNFFNPLKVFFIIVLLCFGVERALADEPLSQLLNNIQTYRAHFTQTVFDPRGQILQTANGEMTLQRPGHFRWEIYQPTKQLLIADGQHIWFYDINLQQITVQKQTKADPDSPQALLSESSKNLSQRFIIQPLKTIQGFTLFPKNKNALFQNITLIFKNNLLYEMHLIDKLDQQTVINFSHIELNPILPKQTFRFVIPKDKNIEIVKD
ncbi:outer membrane lipoprotein chaperone LolA [Rickettsiella grylli]|uniref:Outer-membrane lipoprotein carrier protein n=1 Tax=Rickettsiella grylli TaxID=59196 RepID=A8PQ68_9COXI|nr:outer membrane lipoprotein chaperone LolA [Rickettsiella grylli]EDP46808.1 outer membrane lipoprotein carrier protein LolA [Rickettsiella grylli]